MCREGFAESEVGWVIDCQMIRGSSALWLARRAITRARMETKVELCPRSSFVL